MQLVTTTGFDIILFSLFVRGPDMRCKYVDEKAIWSCSNSKVVDKTY